jgi:hypothetical protein
MIAPLEDILPGAQYVYVKTVILMSAAVYAGSIRWCFP